jgi:1-acyl-sn-glycerol-3-phosphate acyltransferase
MRGWLIAPPIAAGLFLTLLLFNVAQTVSVLLLPISRPMFRAFNRWAANTWWGLCVRTARHVMGVRPEVTGDALPQRENAIILCNHQEMPDITLLMDLALAHGRLGDLKFFVKQPIKFVPGIGWGMIFLDCVFVRRRWTEDRQSIERTFSRLVRDRVPLWLVSFTEGTRFTPDKARASRQYARSAGRPPLTHVLTPRSKGFVASMHGLGDSLDAVYDVTIGYPEGVPTLWQYIQGYAQVAHLHVRRFAADTVPHDPAALTTWLHERYREKDRLLEWFYRRGAFPPALHVIDGAAGTGDDDIEDDDRLSAAG